MLPFVANEKLAIDARFPDDEPVLLPLPLKEWQNELKERIQHSIIYDSLLSICQRYAPGMDEVETLNQFIDQTPMPRWHEDLTACSHAVRETLLQALQQDKRIKPDDYTLKRNAIYNVGSYSIAQ